jgi:putative CocE/NonD family hydrolase
MKGKLFLYALCAILLFICGMFGLPGQIIHAQQTYKANAKLPDNIPKYKGYTEPQYKSLSASSLYVPMHDGTKIAVDLLLPQDLSADVKIPTLIEFTRYWRSRVAGEPSGLHKFFVSHGYAVAVVDVRGTGASFGTWSLPWAQDELKDYGEIVDWIVAEPWSNGKVGAFGNSYGGTSAQLLAAANRPAVKAVIPRHYEFDVYTDNPFPGGILNDWFLKSWNDGNRELDLAPGVRPVDVDADKSLLQEALKQHAKNIDIYKMARAITFRDDTPQRGFSVDNFSVHSFRKEIERSRVAINNWGGWFDAGTADAVIKSFLTINNPQRTLIGPWNHGASQNASPYLSASSQRVYLVLEWLRFFDHYLKDIDTEVNAEKVLYYYTIGEEKWKSTKVWPVAGSTTTRWYMAANNSLSQSPPLADRNADTYKIDFEATTGDNNRWRTQMGQPVSYPDRAAEDRRLLTYTSQPLAEDMEITGYPVVNLYITSTHTDGSFFVYLEDVDEAGKVTYLTEGELRALHRKVSNESPPYQMSVPYHSFKRKDALPLVPGSIAELRFGLLPTSVLIKKGHRIRVAIAGHDKSVFARIPAEGAPTITVARNKQRASFIELPVIPRRTQEAAKVDLLIGLEPIIGNNATIKVDPKTYEAYVGQYQVAQGFVITITKEGDKLLGEAPGQSKIELLPVSENKFSLKEGGIEITFIRDEKGQTTGLVFRQGGQETKAGKIK